MRSRTTSDLPGRCPRCWIRTSFCICADVPNVATRTEVVIVRHEREGWKSTGTARVALQALPHSRLVEYSEDGAASDEALRASGLELLHARDLAGEGDAETPWYLPLTGKERTIRGIPRTRPGRMLTHNAVRVMETIRVAPKGATQVSALLNRAADALVRGGELGIFTPMAFFLAERA